MQPAKKIFSNLKKKINSTSAKIAVVGLGYVGLPIVNLIQKKKYNVIGFDVDEKKINLLKKKKNYIPYLKLNFSKKVKFSNEIKDIEIADIIIIALPTPLKNKKPDLKNLEIFINNFEDNFKNKLIIFESTSYPGTTREYFIERLKKKFNVGINIFYSFSPERINPGENENNLNKIPKIISGETKNCKSLIKLFYSKIFKTVYMSKNIETAEFTKILENVFRAVNIAFINEIKYLAEPLNVNLIDAIEGAKTKPFGYMPFYPGPGIGGHRIPIDPLYLTWKAKQIGLKTRFINLSEKINQENVDKILKFIINHKKNFNKFKILILGLSYKKNIDDVRESSSLKLLQNLYKKKINYDYCDPYVKELKKDELNKYLINKNINYKQINYKEYNIAILMTDHDKFNYGKILNKSKLIIDTRYKYMRMNIFDAKIKNL